jgi:hypothetical protein
LPENNAVRSNASACPQQITDFAPYRRQKSTPDLGHFPVEITQWLLTNQGQYEDDSQGGSVQNLVKALRARHQISVLLRSVHLALLAIPPAAYG